MKKNLISRSWFVVGVLSAATFGAFANLPRTGSISGTMAPTEDVSEIRVQRHSELSFDQDLKRLSAIQGRYHENLPLMKRTSHRPHHRIRKIRAKKRASPRVRAAVGRG
jgi:hypothetical protein